MAYKTIKETNLWGTYFRQEWYEGPEDYVALVARTSEAAVVTFKRDDVPPRLRAWLYRELFKVAAKAGIRFERRGDRLHAPLAELEKVYRLVCGISKHAQLSEGAKALLEAEKEVREKEDLAASLRLRAGLEADMKRRRNRRFNRGSSKS